MHLLTEYLNDKNPNHPIVWDKTKGSEDPDHKNEWIKYEDSDPVDTDPVVIIKPVDTDPVVIKKPVVIIKPVGTDPVVIIKPVDTNPVVKPIDIKPKPIDINPVPTNPVKAPKGSWKIGSKPWLKDFDYIKNHSNKFF